MASRANGSGSWRAAASSLAAAASSRKTGQWFVCDREVAVEDQLAGWPVGGVPLVQAAEEAAEFAEAVADGVPVQRSSAGCRPFQQPVAIAFDMPPLEFGDAGDVCVFGCDQEGELPQRQLGVLHGARPRCSGDLPQVVLHRVGHRSRDSGPLLGSHVGVVRGAPAWELVGQLAVEQGRFQVEQRGRQRLDPAVGDAPSGLQQQAASLVPVALMQFVRLLAEQRHEVGQQG